MRLLATILSIAVICLVGCASSQPITIRVMTYNIHHGKGMDGRIDLKRIAQIIRDADADLVALQEVDRGVKRTGRVDQPAVLAELTGMQAIFEKNIVYQGGEYGNAVLSRLPVEHYENHYLPKSLPNEQRSMLEVHVRVGGEKLIFFATHFDYHPDDGERLASVAMLKELVEQRWSVPIIVAGDMNAPPNSQVVANVNTFLTDSFVVAGGSGFTYPADEPERRIDYVMHTRHPCLRCVKHRVIAEPVASDHRPVLTTFEFVQDGLQPDQRAAPPWRGT